MSEGSLGRLARVQARGAMPRASLYLGEILATIRDANSPDNTRRIAALASIGRDARAPLFSRPRSIPFFEGKLAKQPSAARPARSGFIQHENGSSSLVDPWGNHYIVRIDTDYDGEIRVPGSSSPIRATAICWSYGEPKDPDNPKSAKDNDPKDFITSWR